jgi:hypothetical protein
MLRVLWILSTFVFFIALSIDYGSLPENFPVNFDFRGNPQHFWSKSQYFWFQFSIVGLCQLLIFGLYKYVDKISPIWISLPYKKSYLATEDGKNFSTLKFERSFLSLDYV